jgi:hypothetical protein
MFSFKVYTIWENVVLEIGVQYLILNFWSLYPYPPGTKFNHKQCGKQKCQPQHFNWFFFAPLNLNCDHVF